MDYAQGTIATLHDLGNADPDAPTERTTVVVPMTDREYAGLAAESVLRGLERIGPERVLVPLRAPADRVVSVADWLDSFDLPLSVVWCNGPGLEAELDDRGLDGSTGKGRDVWLALGLLDTEYVALHDADSRTFRPRDVRRLVHPLAHGYSFVKGYYARVENRRLYGRLNRLLYAPLVAALRDEHDAPVLDYLGAFRYALAGECAMTADLARSLRVQRRWGLEVGTLGDAYAHAGIDGSAQVDLGTYEHDHRAVTGPSGLSEMSRGVAAALLRAAEDHGVTPDYETLPARYRREARRFIQRYAADAGFNGLDFDREGELEQVEEYAEAVMPPGPDSRLPAWDDADLDPETVWQAAERDLRDVREG
jgi:glucosyl-3-phosphoglycerate synthase